MSAKIFTPTVFRWRWWQGDLQWWWYEH